MRPPGFIHTPFTYPDGDAFDTAVLCDYVIVITTRSALAALALLSTI